jgi:beta-lactamase superfamily II metal-dependent hydrolase
MKPYCKEHNIEHKEFLLPHNASDHPDNLDTLRNSIPVEVIYLPPNTIIKKPMDQTVITNFKAC